MDSNSKRRECQGLSNQQLIRQERKILHHLFSSKFAQLVSINIMNIIRINHYIYSNNQIQMQAQNIIITLNSSSQTPITLHLDPRITNFNLHPIQSTDYSQPFQIPTQIAASQLPFDIVSRFAQAHNYSPLSPRIKLPICSSNYKDVVDPTTYEVCQRYTNLDYVEEAETVLRLAKWLQFGELEKAIASAIAINYYTGSDEKQIQQFLNKNKLHDITPQQIQQIYEQHKDIFDYIQQKTKQQFIVQQIQNQNQNQEGQGKQAIKQQIKLQMN